MAFGMHPFVERAAPPGLGSAGHRTVREQIAPRDEELFLRIAVASLPLVGLVLGVLGLALWTVH